MERETRLPQSSTSSSAPYFPTLDGWRAVAVLLVMLHHASVTVSDGRWWSGWVNTHQLGVEFFFVLSGFLITSLLVREYEQLGTVSIKAFAVRRFFRLVPAQVLFLAVVATLFALGVVRTSWSSIATSLLWARNWIGNDWVTGHFWSLSVEEQFYAFWPATFLLLTRRGNRLFVCAATIVALAVWAAIDHRLHLFEQVFPRAKTWSRSDLRLPALLWGSLAALALAAPAIERHVARWAKQMLWAIPVLVVAYHRGGVGPLWRSVYWLLIVFSILGTVRIPLSLAGRLLESHPARWIGRRSYGIYLWQQLFLIPPEANWLPWGGEKQILFGFTAAFFLAALSYRFVEKPLHRRGQRASAAILARARKFSDVPAQDELRRTAP